MQVDRTPRILIADVSDTARKELREALPPMPVRVDEAGTAAEVMSALAERAPQLIVCEVRLPDASGFGLCRLLREDPVHHALPIILVSQWATEIDRILALECGADDFLARPFFGRELGSRVSAVLRRTPDRAPRPSGPGPSRIATAPAVGVRPIRVAGRILDLTPKEAAILVQLATSEGAVRSRHQLIETIWGDEDAPSDRCIDSHVKSLRRKLGAAGDSVETVRGVGYRFSPHPDLDVGN